MYLNNSLCDHQQCLAAFIQGINDNSESRKEGPRNADTNPSTEALGTIHSLCKEQGKGDKDDKDDELVKRISRLERQKNTRTIYSPKLKMPKRRISMPGEERLGQDRLWW